VRLGYNSRLDEIHAAILRRVFLPRLEAWTRRRRAVARRYRDGLANPLVRVPPVPATAEPSAHLFPVLEPAEARDAFRAFLEERGVATDVHYPVAIPDQPAMRDVPWEAPFGLARARELCTWGTTRSPGSSWR
jgi:dTDP-4-amino-4,6-dideoxygalactose transaminase